MLKINMEPVDCCTNTACMQTPVLQIDNSCTGIFYRAFFDIYVCSAKHVTYLCKQCCETMHQNFRDIHIFHHYNKSQHGINYPFIDLGICNGDLYVLRITDIVKYLPAICCFDINYEDIPQDYLPEIIDDYYTYQTIIKFQDIPDLVKIIKNQQLFCPFCNCPFESYPSIEVMASHLRTGCVTETSIPREAT